MNNQKKKTELINEIETENEENNSVQWKIIYRRERKRIIVCKTVRANGECVVCVDSIGQLTNVIHSKIKPEGIDDGVPMVGTKNRKLKCPCRLFHLFSFFQQFCLNFLNSKNIIIIIINVFNTLKKRYIRLVSMCPPNCVIRFGGNSFVWFIFRTKWREIKPTGKAEKIRLKNYRP